MEDEFFFSLLRISVAQILKALGFDKCKPSVLNIVTDLYIKHLQLVVGNAQKFALARTNSSNSIDVPDILQAFQAAGTVKPLRFGSVDHKDEYDESNTRSGEAFFKWLKYSDQFSVSRKLSEVPSSLIHNLMEKRRIDTSAETDQERKKRRLKERQDFYNQLKQGEDVNQIEAMGRYVDELDEDEINASDRLSWLTYLAEKDLKLGHNLKFVNSCIQDSLMAVHNNPKFHPTAKDGEQALSLFHNHIVNNTKNDHILLQIHDVEMPQDGELQSTVIPSQQLKAVLPYNVKYNLVLCDDGLDQYIAYASAHKQEIEERLKTLQPIEVMEVDSPPKNGEANAHGIEGMGTEDYVNSTDQDKVNTEPTTDKTIEALNPEGERNLENEKEKAPEDRVIVNDLEEGERKIKENDGENAESTVSERLQDVQPSRSNCETNSAGEKLAADLTKEHAKDESTIQEETKYKEGALKPDVVSMSKEDTVREKDVHLKEKNVEEGDMATEKKDETSEDGANKDKGDAELEEVAA